MLTASIVANLWFAVMAGCGGGGGDSGVSPAIAAASPGAAPDGAVAAAQASEALDPAFGGVDSAQVRGSTSVVVVADAGGLASAGPPATTASDAVATPIASGAPAVGVGGSGSSGTSGTSGSSGTSGTSGTGTGSSGTGGSVSGTSPVGTSAGGTGGTGGSGTSSTGTSGTSPSSPTTGSTSTGSTGTSSPSTGVSGTTTSGTGASGGSSSPSAPTTAAPAVLPVVAGGYRSTSAEAARLYGPGTAIIDGLWNIDARRSGGTDLVAAIRFRAPLSGPVSSIRLYWSDGSGYAGGDGGDIAIRLLPDDGSARHLPDWQAAPLATGRRVPGAMSMSGGTYSTSSHRFSPDTLTGSGQLEAGRLYHLVAINQAPNPAANWSSWDMAWTVAANGPPLRWHDPLDFAALYGWRTAGSAASPSWEDWTVDGHAGAYVVPILQVTMADGRVFGYSNMETGNVDSGGRVWKNGNANPVRERFTPTAARTISGLSIQTAKASGSGGLGWQVMRGSTVLASGVIDQSAANYRVDTSVGNTGVMTWYDVALPAPVRLDAATTYDVMFTPQGSSVWVFADQRNGSGYGFSSPAAFTESQAQHYLGGVWINANHWSKFLPASGSNWRVVLHQAP